MYNLIFDIEALRQFFDKVVPPLKNDEVYFVSLSARAKYLTKEQKEFLALGRTEMFERRIIREKNWIKFLRTLRKFEANDGAYTSKKGSSIPQSSIVVYWNINPSSSLQVYKEFTKTMTDYMAELGVCARDSRKSGDILSRVNKMDRLLMNCYQKNKGTKHYIDIDFDISSKDYSSVVIPFRKSLRERGVRHLVVGTKSGYHILLDRSTLNYNFNEDVYKANENLIRVCLKEKGISLNEYFKDRPKTEINVKELTGGEIIVNKNDMIPLPGTYQGGFPVNILDTYDW